MENGQEQAYTSQNLEKVQEMLTPEQMIGSVARYSVMRLEESLVEAGAPREAVEKAADIESEKAVQEFKENRESNPANRIKNILVGLRENDPERYDLLLALLNKSVRDWKTVIEEAQAVDLALRQPARSVADLRKEYKIDPMLISFSHHEARAEDGISEERQEMIQDIAIALIGESPRKLNFKEFIKRLPYIKQGEEIPDANHVRNLTDRDLLVLKDNVIPGLTVSVDVNKQGVPNRLILFVEAESDLVEKSITGFEPYQFKSIEPAKPIELPY